MQVLNYAPAMATKTKTLRISTFVIGIAHLVVHITPESFMQV
ncbi:transposase, IS605 OrfB family [Brevibacillus laterosporus GI-9]|nr:transposase, IS605 OrfB family [Brevibacillus laterosporus GI-9]